MGNREDGYGGVPGGSEGAVSALAAGRSSSGE